MKKVLRTDAGRASELNGPRTVRNTNMAIFFLQANTRRDSPRKGKSGVLQWQPIKLF